MTYQTVSQSYLDGIKEGRTYKKRFNPGLSDMVQLRDNCKMTLKGFSGGPVADILRGERDFWNDQIKKVKQA